MDGSRTFAGAYRPSRDFIVYLNRLPDIAKARAELAAVYRKARRENPKMARLYFKQLQMAKRTTARDLACRMIDSAFVPAKGFFQ